MLWLLIVLQWSHILAGIFWFGSAMMTTFILVPALKKTPPEAGRQWMGAFVKRYAPIVGPIGGLTILLGIGRGIAGGVLGSLLSPYGLTWIASIIVGGALAGIGARLIAPTAQKLAEATGSGEMEALFRRIDGYGRIEFAGFLVIFSLMIAMRFGY